ncbi:MAG: winged helix-turn-helix transcriptional regulator [Myxococcales bacterium]|nr:winged helix-turn-helix transcriptional regulator [Myxococcales bacterium]
MASRDFQRRSMLKLAAYGYDDLKPSHSALFSNLGVEGARLVDVAAKAGITKQSMAAIADELEVLGYIERLPDPSDGRARIIRLSKRGWECVAKWDNMLEEIVDEYGASIGAARVERLTKDLAKLVATLAEDEDE